MNNFNSNWFTDNLPCDIAQRHDGRYNVWNMTAVKVDDEIDLKWQVIAVFDNEQDAKEFVANV